MGRDYSPNGAFCLLPLAIGQGSVIWVYISEIFPNHIRSSGQSFGTSTHWVLAALIPSMIPFLFSKIGASYVFLFS